MECWAHASSVDGEVSSVDGEVSSVDGEVFSVDGEISFPVIVEPPGVPFNLRVNSGTLKT